MDPDGKTLRAVRSISEECQVEAKRKSKMKAAKKKRKGLKHHLNVFCFQNPISSFILVVIVLILKLTMTILYIVRVSLDDVDTCAYCGNFTNLEDGAVNWGAILYIQRPLPIWGIEVSISIFTLGRMFIVTYVRFKGDFYKSITLNLVMETCVSLPIILTLIWEPLRQVFWPTFLNCWLAKRMLDQNVLSHRQMRGLSLFTQKAVAVINALLCLVFSGICGVQHIQRGSAFTHLTLFETFYFVMVTLSTVGYGDYSPDIWPSQLFVVLLIIVAVIVIPDQVESLASTWIERRRLGGSYAGGNRSEAKHVVFCATSLSDEVVEEFLNEFYTHSECQDYYVVFMCPSDLDASTRRVLTAPLWLHRCMHITGSCLKDSDLARAGMKSAKACFLLGETSESDKSIADQHTILRAWAVKDYAPQVQQYVQIFRPENKVHLKFSKFIVCEDEFKFAMLAYNCLIPGTSTLLTLLLHTSNGEEGQNFDEPWIKLYGQCSDNEIYSIRLDESEIFSCYENANFSYAALNSHKKYGVLLFAVQPTSSSDSILLNPGFSYILKGNDLCIYISTTQEEDMDFANKPTRNSRSAGSLNHQKVYPTLERAKSATEFTKSGNGQSIIQRSHWDKAVDSLDANIISKSIYGETFLPTLEEFRYEDASDRWVTDAERCDIRIGYLPVVPYLGMTKVLCHLRKEKKPICCLALDKECKHCSYNTIKQYAWSNPATIVAAESAHTGFYNFILPLRAHHQSRKHLKPIILMFQTEPEDAFLDILSWFPLVFWMLGSIENLDSMLTAGINFADNVVIVTKEGTSQGAGHEGSTEGDLADCSTIIAVQMLKRYFPHVNFTTELLQSSNMRFMHFQANSEHAAYMSEVGKFEKERGSTIPFMFRLQFAAGYVFSTNMVDTMLYQVVVFKSEPWAKTFGTMFTFLCSTSGDVPIGLYRTERVNTGEESKECVMPLTDEVQKMVANKPTDDEREIASLVKNRLKVLGLSPDDYEYINEPCDKVSYVLINPDYDLELKDEDIVFVIRPARTRQSKVIASVPQK